MKTLDQKDIIGITALLVHAAKIDEQYSDHEKILIKKFIKSYLKNDNNDEILKKAEDTYIFKGEKKKKTEKLIKFDKKENPFKKLLSLNIK